MGEMFDMYGPEDCRVDGPFSDEKRYERETPKVRPKLSGHPKGKYANWSKKQRLAVKGMLAIRDGDACCCGARPTLEQFTIDHLRPQSEGGSNELDNLRLLCWDCNAAHAWWPERATKKYKCHECDKPIRIGEHYGDAGEYAKFKRCARCEKIMVHNHKAAWRRIRAGFGARAGRNEP